MKTIAHPTSARDEDRVAFEHATALAREAGARLVSVHAGSDPTLADRMPDAVQLAARWQTEPCEGFVHDKLVHDCCVDDPSEGVLDALKGLSPDLVVATTHRRGIVARVLTESYAEAIANNVRVPSLLIPLGARGFVDAASGRMDLHRVLVPVGDVEEATAALWSAAFLLELAGVEEAEIVLLRVGSEAPTFERPVREGWSFVDLHAEGTIEEAVEREAKDACVIVMATRGHNSFGDVIVGSHTERVLRRATCPVLSVPVL